MMQVPKENVGSGLHGPASVGVTSSDERAPSSTDAINAARANQGDPPLRWDPEKERYEAVPSSDEPEGDGQSYADRVVTWAKYVELHEAYENVSRREKRWLVHLAAIRERLGVRPDSRTLKHILRAIDRLAPVPVGDAEPVQWGLESADGEIVGTARMREDAESLAAELLGGLDLKVVPLFRLPESSQDAGADAWRIHIVNGPDKLTTDLEIADAMEAAGEHVSPLSVSDLTTRLSEVERAAERLLDAEIGSNWRTILEGSRFPAPAVELGRVLAAGKAGSDDAA